MIQEITNYFQSGKKILSILAVCLLISGSLLAQGVPQAMSYQAVVRDASGDPIPDTPVELKMSIKAGNVIIYQELHATSTNGFGLVTVNIGLGQVLLGDFSSIDWAANLHFLFVEVSVDGGPFVNMGISRLLSVPYSFVAQKAVEGDADADPANELQTLSQSGTNVVLSNGGGTISIVDNDNDPANELQDISIVGHDLSLSNGSTLTLPDDVDDADADPSNELQDISIVGHDLSLSNGSTLTLPDDVDDADADPANELQSLSQTGTDVTLSNGGGTVSVADDDNDPANELQDWSNLPGIPAGFIDGVDNVDDADADPANELQSLSQTGTDVTLSNGGGTISVADDDNDPANELQDISIVGHDLSLSNGSTLTLPDNVDDADADPVNELQSLSQTGTDVTLSNGGGTISVADDDDDPDNELQYLSQAGSVVTLSNGGGSISVADDDDDPANELQALSLNGNILELSNGNSVVLPLIPVGTIVPFAGEVLPAGWLLCDGGTRGRLNFANLFAVIGESWGEGDGLNTFNLPDLRGQFLRGKNGTAGEDPEAGSRTAKYTGGATGNNVGSYQDEAFKSHNHTSPPHKHGHGGYKDTGGNGQAFESAGGVDRTLYSHNTTVTINHNGGAETRPKNAYVLYIIKY